MGKLGLVLGIVLVVAVMSAGCFSSKQSSQQSTTITTQTTVIPAAPENSNTSTTVTTIPSTEPTEEVLTASVIPARPELKIIKRITGSSSTLSENISVPYSSWELWYTAEPFAIGGQDSHSASGSQSVVFPKLTIQVKDLRSGKVVEIEPPGGLDAELWRTSTDPRPWKEKIYSGNSDYNILVTARFVTSYTLEVRVLK